MGDSITIDRPTLLATIALLEEANTYDSQGINAAIDKLKSIIKHEDTPDTTISDICERLDWVERTIHTMDGLKSPYVKWGSDE